jgi:hypothetical protein
LVVWNTDSGSPPPTHHFTLTSQPDAPFLRTGDITNYAVGAGVISVFNLEPDTTTGAATGWVNNFGQILFSADSANVYFAVIER